MCLRDASRAPRPIRGPKVVIAMCACGSRPHRVPVVSQLADRPWVPPSTADRVRTVSAVADRAAPDVLAEIDRLVEDNHRIHDVECLNLNPATNVMNPRAQRLLSAGLAS